MVEVFAAAALFAALEVTPIKEPEKPKFQEDVTILVCNEPKKHWVETIPYSLKSVRTKVKKGSNINKGVARKFTVRHNLQMNGANRVEKGVDIATV